MLGCTVLHQVGVSFDLYYDARKHKIKIKKKERRFVRISKYWAVGSTISRLRERKLPKTLIEILIRFHCSEGSAGTEINS